MPEAKQAETSASVPVPAPKPPVESTRFQFDSILPGWVFWSLAILLIFSIRRAYARTTRKLAAEKKLLLGLLRLSAFGVLMLCLARPVLVSTWNLHEGGLCFIALDSSASMDLRDTAQGRTRWEHASDILKAHRQELEKLGNAFEMQRYLFDSSVRKVSALPGETLPGGKSFDDKPRGTGTDLASLLETFSAEAGGMSAAGAMLITDGRHNAMKDVIPAALALERAGVPLYVIGLGQEATPTAYKDIRIKEFSVPEKAFIKSRMIMRVEIESSLPEPAAVPLTIDIGDKRIYEKQVILQPGPNRIYPVIEVPYVPDKLGVHRVVAGVGSVLEEADTNNNVRTAFFRVYRSKLGIWYVEGAMRKEFGAIRTALETAPNVKFTALSALKARTLGETDLLPWNAEDGDQYKLIIIGDLHSTRFDWEQLRTLKKFVEDGGSVLMIGGFSNFGAGNWQNSPIGDVLPVEMMLQDGFRDGPLGISIEQGEEQHPILAVGETPEQSAALWKQLPPLPGINKIRVPRPAARVLLRAGDSSLLVVQEYGKGRSAVLTADMTWQWILKGNQPELHKKFWRNLATWLTRSDYRDTDKAVFVDAERLQLQSGDEAIFHVHIHETEKAGKLKEAPIAATLTRTQGDLESPVFKEEMGRGQGEFEKRFSLGSPGTYRFRAAALSTSGTVIDSDSVDVQVTAPDVEHDNPRANLNLLRRIATLSGGTYFDPEHAGDAFAALLKRHAGYTKPMTGVTDLWNSPWAMLLFILLLSAEWTLRKKWGLI
jgi:uncharacterized membrane protein